MNGMRTILDLSKFIDLSVLVMLRLSGFVCFAPVFSSPSIAPHIKAGLVFAMTIMLSPVVYIIPGTSPNLTISSIIGELGIGLLFGLAEQILVEMVLFASSLMSIEFSFSLANLIDPNSKADTPVLGEILTWLVWLVVIVAGLDRTLLSALIRSFSVNTIGHVATNAESAAGLVVIAGGIFIAGVQLASPVLAAALVIEICLGLVSKMSPQLPAMVLGIPVKTLVSYVVLIVSLSVWPNWIEMHFMRLLDAAERIVMNV
jgi:flagellar biosynthesis protein FliR